MTPLAREWCQQTLARRNAIAKLAADQLAEARASNAKDAQQLAALASEIAQSEKQLDWEEDLTAIQLLQAKREQHSRLKSKFAAVASKRLADAAQVEDSQSPAATLNYSWTMLLEDEKAELLAAMRPYFRAEVAAQRAANDSDAGAVLRRLQSHAGTAEVQEIMAAIAAGENPPWLFH